MPNLTHDFAKVDKEKLSRSRWFTPLKTITASQQGALIPLGFYDVIPNSKIKCDVNSLTRLLLTPHRPFMGDMYLTYGAYFVPYRVLFNNFQNMFGDGKPSEWSAPIEHVMPGGTFKTNGTYTAKSPGAGYDAAINCSISTGNNIVSFPGSLADYLGLPLTLASGSDFPHLLNIAPFLAYERIWSDFYRDENYQNIDPDLEKAKVLASGSTSLTNFYFALHYANRFHDYFTSVLPDTQKGPAVGAVGMLDTFSEMSGFTGGGINLGDIGGNPLTNKTLGIDSSGDVNAFNTMTQTAPSVVGGSNLGIALDVNAIRNSFALQRAKERNARTGSRYQEALRGTFDANPPFILDRAEFLGGETVPLNLMSVPQTGENAGKLGAFSSTGNSSSCFIKDFDEPGILMFVGVVRVRHNYTLGIERSWFKFRRYDYYDPALAHISEQPVYAKQMNCRANSDDVMGFQEPWVEYEKIPQKITGYLRDTSKADFLTWTLQDTNGSTSPATFYPEKDNEVAKVCIDYSAETPSYQFGIDFNAVLTITAPKPIYAIPGFIDHIMG